jgi:hypothetical protein
MPLGFWLIATLLTDPAPKPAAIPPAAHEFVIHVTVAEYPRAKDESDLVNLLREDLQNTGKGLVNLKLRDRINAIMKRLAKEE